MSEEKPERGKLEDIIRSMGDPVSGERSLFETFKTKAEEPLPAPAPPRPPAPAQEPGGAEGPAAPGELERRIRELEAKLAETQEKALAATLRVQEKEAAQKEMEAMFQSTRAQRRAEETLQAERELGAKMQGRVQALEERLDKQISEFQALWMKAMNDMMASQREAPKAATAAEVEELRKQANAASDLPARIEGEASRAEQDRKQTAEALAALARDLVRTEEASRVAARLIEERIDKKLSEFQALWMKAQNDMLAAQREAPKGATAAELDELRKQVNAASALQARIDGETAQGEQARKQTAEALAALRPELEELRKLANAASSLPARIEGESARAEQDRKQTAEALAALARDLVRVDEAAKGAARLLEERLHGAEETEQSRRLEYLGAAKQIEILGVQVGALQGDLETLQLVTRRVSTLEEAGELLSRRHEAAAERSGQVEERVRAAEEGLRAMAANVQAEATASGARLAALEAFAAGTSSSLQEFSSYANRLAGKMNEFAAALQAQIADAEKQNAQADRKNAALESSARALSQETVALRSGNLGLSDRLTDLSRKMKAMEETVSARVGAVEAGLSEATLRLPEEVMAKVRGELQEFRVHVDASVESKVSALDASLGMLTRAFPESLLRKMKEETAGIEAAIAELRARVVRPGPPGV